jgi:RNA polymerase sigma-70 factor, ECF subfamily
VASVDLSGFAAFVTERNISMQALALHGADLFLAYGCAAGDPAAIKAFEAGPLQVAAAAIVRLLKEKPAQEEVLQRTRVRLLVGAPPLVATYAGAGSLASWVRVSALRIAIDSRAAPVISDSGGLEQVGAGDMPIDRRLGLEQFRTRLQSAMRTAIGDLRPEERALLRMHFFDGLTVDRLGVLLGVHRATAARRLVAIRRKVLDGTKRLLNIDFGSTSAELASLWRAFGDEIEVSLSSIV